MATYIHAIPYMFYALVALIIVPLFIFGVIPKLGAMKSAYKRVEETGQVYSKESQKGFPETTELPHKGSDRWLFRRRKQRSRRI